MSIKTNIAIKTNYVYGWHNGILEIEAPELVLKVKAVDDSDNKGIATAVPLLCFEYDDGDDDDD